MGETWNETEAADYLTGDRSRREGAAAIGIGLALLALVAEVRAVRIRSELEPADVLERVLESETWSGAGRLVLEPDVRAAIMADVRAELERG